MFDRLLLPQIYRPPLNLASVKQSGVSGMLLTYLHGSRHGTNTYVLGFAYNRSMALELVKYQTIMVMLLANHSPARGLEYDSLLRQAVACDPTLRWDTIKEDIYVWAITQGHNTSTSQFQSSTSTFHDRLPISARLGPPSAESGKATPPHATHTAEGKEICKRYNVGRCTKGEECIFTHVCWHPGKVCAKRP